MSNRCREPASDATRPGTRQEPQQRATRPARQALAARPKRPHNARPGPRVKRNIQGFHELAHALIRSHAQALELSYAQEELVVESVAHACCQLVGLDTNANSIPYLASWAEQASLQVLEQTAHLADRLARQIEDRLLTSRGVAGDSGAADAGIAA